MIVKATQGFRQVRVASCVIPYVMCGGLYWLRDEWESLRWRGPCPPLYTLGRRVTWNPGSVWRLESFLSTTWVVSIYLTSTRLVQVLTWCTDTEHVVLYLSYRSAPHQESHAPGSDKPPSSWTSHRTCLPSTSRAALRLHGNHGRVVGFVGRDRLL
jgi:hypothetical protein